MKKYGIFYGSVSGTTADVARRIGRCLEVSDEDIHDVGVTAPDRLGDYEVIILGSSTHGCGELADDWFDFADGAVALDLSGHKIALFGCGDESMEDTFCDAVGELYDRFKHTGASMRRITRNLLIPESRNGLPKSKRKHSTSAYDAAGRGYF